MKRVISFTIYALWACSALAAKAPDTSLVTGPNYQQVPISQAYVTPTGGTQTTLGAALGSIDSTIALQNVNTSGTAYVGPCDLVSCGVAYSVTRSMTAAYNGPLFQLTRASDGGKLDVGQINHTADMSVEVQFCALTTCNYSILYDQINSTDLTPPTNAGGLSPCTPANGLNCSPQYFVDPATGLPIIRTPYPAQLYSASSTGIIGGSSPLSVMWYGRTEGWSTCCGLFGTSHTADTTDTAGTDFIPGLGYSTGNPFVNCASAGTTCIQVDIEQFTQGPNYTPATNQDMFNVFTFDGIAGTNTIKAYVNSSTASYSATPLAVMNVGTSVRLGGGGDLSHVDSVFREGLISNTELPANRVAALSSNITTFYSARTPNPCQSTADINYFWASSAGGQGSNPGISGTLAAYSLRRMSASYSGPIADLTDSAGTVRTFGPSKTGCFIDQAAVTFCAENSPCKVSRLYNQGTFTAQNNSYSRDPGLDMIQATSAARPTVKFGGLNGLPTMVFAGSQSLCTPPIVSSSASILPLMSFVAKRTGNTSAFGEVIASGNGSSDGMGFNSSANSVVSFFGSSLTGAAADNAFHAVVWEATATSAGAAALYTGGSSLATGTQSAFHNFAQNGAGSKVCFGINQTGSSPLTGEIAEGVIANIAGPTSPYTSMAATLYAAQSAAWGVTQ